MEKNKKILLGLASVVVVYSLVRHSKVGIYLGEQLSKLTNNRCGVITTGGGWKIFTNSFSCDAKKVSKSPITDNSGGVVVKQY